MTRKRVPLKDQLFNRDRVSQLSVELHHSHAALDVPAFVEVASSRLPELELKQRIAWITDCLEKYLPGDYGRAVDLILGSLPAPCDPTLTDGDFGDFLYAPYGEFIARRGCTHEHLQRSLAALRELTTRFSAEFAIRPFIATFPRETMDTLTRWARDDHYHVRRLVSEGTRPRLPWAKRLSASLGYAIPLLDRLHSDTTRYVTRSVANHVNDISKSDPMLALDMLDRWKTSNLQETKELDYILRRATRSLLKEGNLRAMSLHTIEGQS